MNLRLVLILCILLNNSCYPQDHTGSIVMINVGDASRMDIAKAIKFLNSYKPKVISVDLQFSRNTDYKSDSALVDVLWSTDNLVMASVIANSSGEYDGLDVRYEFVYGSLPEFIPFESNTGFINALTESDEINTLKRFSMFEKVEDKIEYHFAIQTALKFDSLKAVQFLQSNLKIVDVNYRDCLNKIATYSLYDVLDNKISKEKVAGKIILFGFQGPGDKDKFLLPLNNENSSKTSIYGLEYLACIIIQVISGHK